MAKGLKAGDSVSVSKPKKFKRTSVEYKNGLKSVAEGQVGQVIDSARGRSVVVDFEGKRATISSQSLQKVPTGDGSQRARRRAAIANPAQADTSKAPTTAASAAGQSPTALFNYESPTFAASIANKLLLNGGLKDENETVVVEIHLSELPTAVRDRIQSLMQAKLSLGLEPEPTVRKATPSKRKAAPAKGRSGRKPKAAQA